MFPATTNLGYPRYYIGKTGTPSHRKSGDMQVVNILSGIRLWDQLEIRLLMGSPRKQIQMQDKKKTKQMRSEGKWTRVSISSEIIMNRQCWGEQGGPQRQSERLFWNNLIYNAANMQHLKLCSFHWNKISGLFGWATHVKVQWQKDLMGKIRQKTWKKTIHRL